MEGSFGLKWSMSLMVRHVRGVHAHIPAAFLSHTELPSTREHPTFWLIQLDLVCCSLGNKELWISRTSYSVNREGIRENSLYPGDFLLLHQEQSALHDVYQASIRRIINEQTTTEKWYSQKFCKMVFWVFLYYKICNLGFESKMSFLRGCIDAYLNQDRKYFTVAEPHLKATLLQSFSFLSAEYWQV